MINRDELLNKVENGAKWDVAVAIKRGNPLPLDSTSIFDSYAKALEYASTSALAYPTQIIGVVNANGSNEYYGITQDGGLEEIGGKVDIDGMSIMLQGEKLAIKGFGKEYYKYVTVLESVEEVSQLNADAAEGCYCKVGTTWYTKSAQGWGVASTYPADGDHYVLTSGFVAGLQPKVKLNSSAQLEIAWYEPSTTTVEGLSDQMNSLTQTVNTLQGTVSTNTKSINDNTNNIRKNEESIAAQDNRIKQAFVSGKYDANLGKVTFTTEGGASSEVAMTGIAHAPVYNSVDMKLIIPVFGQDDVVVNIPKDNFVRSGRYEAEYDLPDGGKGPAIVLVVDNEDTDSDKTTREIVIPAAALVDVYTGKTSATAKVTVAENNEIGVDVIFREIVANHLVTVDSLGNVTDSGKTIEDITNAIAEAIKTVDDKIKIINESINSINSILAKLNIGEGNADEIIISTEDGIARSGKKVGGSTLSASPDGNTLATEAAVANLMKWQTLA